MIQYDILIEKHIQAADLLKKVKDAEDGIKRLQQYKKHIDIMSSSDWYVKVRAKNRKIKLYKEFISKKISEYEKLMTTTCIN